MKLTKTQLAWLRNSFRNKDNSRNFWRVFWTVKNAWLTGILLAGIGVWVFIASSSVMGCILISVAWGNIFASIIMSKRAVKLWPVFRVVTRWDRVEELIRENGSGTT